MPINSLGYSCIKKLQRDNLWHAYNEPINFYSVVTESQIGEVKMKPLSIVFATLFASELSQKVFQSNLLKTTGLCISNFIDLTMLIISLNLSRTQKNIYSIH